MAAKKRQVARSAEDLAKKRDLILDAAMTLLMERGYTKTTISGIAKAAGIGRGTVYWHFESKDDLFFALMERDAARIDGGLAPLMEHPMPALDRLELLIRGGFALYGEEVNMFQAFLSILSGVEEETKQRILAMFRNIYGKYNSLIEGLLEAGKAEGTVRQDLDSPVVAASMVVLLDALFLQVYFGLIPNDPERLSNAVLVLLQDGCRAPQGR